MRATERRRRSTLEEAQQQRRVPGRCGEEGDTVEGVFPGRRGPLPAHHPLGNRTLQINIAIIRMTTVRMKQGVALDLQRECPSATTAIPGPRGQQLQQEQEGTDNLPRGVAL